MTRTYFSFWGDSVAHATELNWGKPVYHTPPASPMSHVLSAKCASSAMFVYTVTQYLNLPHFRPETGFLAAET